MGSASCGRQNPHTGLQELAPHRCRAAPDPRGFLTAIGSKLCPYRSALRSNPAGRAHRPRNPAFPTAVGDWLTKGRRFASDCLPGVEALRLPWRETTRDTLPAPASLAAPVMVTMPHAGVVAGRQEGPLRLLPVGRTGSPDGRGREAGRSSYMDHTPIAIGTRTYWVSDEEKLVLLAPEDRAQHLYVVGKTGLGKSTLLRNLILQDLYAGRGVGLLDPHGDLARDVLDAIPRGRTNEVLYFNPGDLARPVGLNLLPKVAPYAAHLVVSGVLSAFRGIWGSSWGPRLEYILGHSLAALLDRGLTILALPRLLSDDAFRERVTAKVRDPVIRAFWREEYARYERRFRLEAIAPIQNKIGRLLANAPMRNILGQTRSRFDACFLMDRGRIMIANLAKGVIGEDHARLLGALLLSQFQWAAMQRSGNPDSPRTPFYLYIDEFQTFATEALTSILAEARKYGLALILAHQYLDQLTDEIRQSVFGNAGNLVAFRVGQADARILEDEFGGDVKMGNLVSLGKHEIYARLLDHGRAIMPFRGRTLPPIRGAATGHREAVIRHSQERYGRSREEVERKVDRWLGG